MAYAVGAVAQNPPANVRRITLKEAVATALKQQPDLSVARAQALAADQQHRQTLAAYLPSLTFGWTTSDTYASSPQTAGTGGSVANSTSYADLTISYTVLDSGKRLATEQSAKAVSRAAGFALESQRQIVIANATTYYYELLRRIALVAVQRASVEHAQSTLDLTQAQVQQGTQATKDVYQIRADLETAKVELLNAQNNLAVAQAQLKQALGMTDDADLDPVDIRTDERVSAEANDSLDALLNIAFKSRPDVLQAQQNLEREKANVRLSRASNGMTLSLTAGLSSVMVENQSNERTVNLTASFPLFDGGASRAAIRQAEAIADQYAAQLASTKLAAKVDVETAFRTLQTARASVPAALTAQQAAQVSFDAASEARKEGVGTVVDVITAQSQLVQAQTNYVQALYTLYTADVALERAIGHADAILGGMS